MAASGSRIWFVDVGSRVGTFDMGSGEVKTIGKLRSDAHVAFWVVGRSFVFGVDDATGQVHLVNTVTESIDAYPLNVLSPVSAVAVGPDDRLWLALRDASYLLAFDPRTHGIDAFDLPGEARVNALAVDAAGRIVYSDDLHARVGTLDLTTMKVSQVIFSRRGSTTAMIVDESGMLWLGTSTGDLYSVIGASVRQVLNVRMPVSSLVLDRTGRAWFLAPIPNGIPGFGYAPADGSQGVRSIPGPAIGLAFGEAERVFSADPRGAFYVAAELGR
jgi:ligand-binding sensor domain-containing protein